MGSSTRNSYKRSERIINQEIEKGNINTEAYVTSVDNYMEEKVVPIIEFEFKEIDFNKENKYGI